MQKECKYMLNYANIQSSTKITKKIIIKNIEAHGKTQKKPKNT